MHIKARISNKLMCIKQYKYEQLVLPPVYIDRAGMNQCDAGLLHEKFPIY
jgi:hypothetical protein